MVAKSSLAVRPLPLVEASHKRNRQGNRLAIFKDILGWVRRKLN